jgi:hypothetical protein
MAMHRHCVLYCGVDKFFFCIGRYCDGAIHLAWHFTTIDRHPCHCFSSLDITHHYISTYCGPTRKLRKISVGRATIERICNFRLPTLADQCPLSEVKQTSQFMGITSVIDPKRTFVTTQISNFWILPFWQAGSVASAIRCSLRARQSMLDRLKSLIDKRLLIDDRNDQRKCCDIGKCEC